MTSLTDTLFEQKQTEVVLPRNSEKAQKVLEGLDGTVDRILLVLETGKYEVWAKMAKQSSLIINDTPTTRIGEYDVPGRYKFTGYTSKD